MTPELFFENFGHLAEAPGGVAKLKELVLGLAVRGRLVEQDPEDEPAEGLVGRLTERREALFRSGEAVRPRGFKADSPTGGPYPLPPSWRWERLGCIAQPQAGFAFKSLQFNDLGEGVPLIRIRDINSSSTQVFFSGEYREEFLVNQGDLLIGMDGDFKVAFWRGPPALLNQRVTRLRFYTDLVAPAYVAPALQEYLDSIHGKKSYTTVQHLSGKQIASAPIPLPPLSEQHRIVAKVDQLMALCDQLETRQQERNQTRIALNKASLHHLVTAPDDRAFNKSWERVRDGFATALENKGDPSAFRDVILRLAIRGRLERQDPTDTPVSVLLKMIADERREREQAGRLRRLRKSPPVAAEEEPYPIPSSWKWERLGRVTFNRDGERVPLSRTVRESRSGPYPYYGASGVIDYIDNYLFDCPLLLIGEDGANLLRRSTPIAFIADGQYWVNNHAHVLDGISPTCLK